MKFSLAMLKIKTSRHLYRLVAMQCFIASCSSFLGSHKNQMQESATLKPALTSQELDDQNREDRPDALRSRNFSQPSQATNIETSFWIRQTKLLQKQEYENPLDPAIKWELARLHWCLGSRGPAIEGWNWILQFQPNSEWAKKVKKLTTILRSNNEEEIPMHLSCAG